MEPECSCSRVPIGDSSIQVRFTQGPAGVFFMTRSLPISPSPSPIRPCPVSMQHTSHLFVCLVSKPCLTLCNPTDCSPPGSSGHGISQARMLEWVAMPFSRGSFQSRDPTRVSCLLHWRFINTEPCGKPHLFARLQMCLCVACSFA